MTWSIRRKIRQTGEIVKKSQKVLYDDETHRVILVIDHIDEGFMRKIISLHNESAKIYDQGLKDGRDITVEAYREWMEKVKR